MFSKYLFHVNKVLGLGDSHREKNAVPTLSELGVRVEDTEEEMSSNNTLGQMDLHVVSFAYHKYAKEWAPSASHHGA